MVKVRITEADGAVTRCDIKPGNAGEPTQMDESMQLYLNGVPNGEAKGDQSEAFIPETRRAVADMLAARGIREALRRRGPRPIVDSNAEAIKQADVAAGTNNSQARRISFPPQDGPQETFLGVEQLKGLSQEFRDTDEPSRGGR